MHVLVTGGTGFIGRSLCVELLRSRHSVTVLTRDVRKAVLLPFGTRVVNALERIDSAEPIGGIINLAGENLADGRWNAERKLELVDSRVQSTRRMLAYIANCKVKPQVLISASAIGWYGARGDEPLTESSTSGKFDEFQAQLCRAWEAEARTAEKMGTRVCIVRTGIVLERDGGPLEKMLPAFRLGLGGRFGNGRQWMSWIHREDMVAILVWLLEHPDARGIWNATAPVPVTNAEFARDLGATLQRRALLPMPGWLLRLLIGGMAELLLTGQKVLPLRLQEGEFLFRHPRLPGALANIFRQS
ncbi:MAG TPA: TIGR01777 family oxidoreductase [Solimonas sp.]|nr:TIGR01777 family oxidoreductase [Solimonas sp.]